MMGSRILVLPCGDPSHAFVVPRPCRSRGRLRLILLLLVVPLARAADAPGWYVGASVPVVFIDDTHTTTGAVVDVSPTAQLSYEAGTTTKYDAGFKLDGVLGYEFGNGWRAEGELFYAQSGVKSLTYTGITLPQIGRLPGETVVPVEGDVSQMGLAANLWYDFNPGSKWRPYLGGGLLWVHVDQGDLKFDEQALAQAVADSVAAATGQPAVPFPPGYVARAADTDSVFGYHLGLGLGYAWSDGITLHAGYRRQTTQEVAFEGRNANSRVDSTTDLRVHFFEVGLRYRF